MLELCRLLEAGYEVTFLAGDRSGPDRAYEVRLITPDGDAVTALGATPSAALGAAAAE